jgi:hypothetical protein
MVSPSEPARSAIRLLLGHPRALGHLLDVRIEGELSPLRPFWGSKPLLWSFTSNLEKKCKGLQERLVILALSELFRFFKLQILLAGRETIPPLTITSKSITYLALVKKCKRFTREWRYSLGLQELKTVPLRSKTETRQGRVTGTGYPGELGSDQAEALGIPWAESSRARRGDDRLCNTSVEMACQ